MIGVSIAYTDGIKGATSSDVFRLRMGPKFARRRPENIRAGLYLGCSRFLIAAITSIITIHWIRRAGRLQPTQSLVLTCPFQSQYTLLSSDGERSAATPLQHVVPVLELKGWQIEWQ